MQQVMATGRPSLQEEGDNLMRRAISQEQKALGDGPDGSVHLSQFDVLSPRTHRRQKEERRAKEGGTGARGKVDAESANAHEHEPNRSIGCEMVPH